MREAIRSSISMHSKPVLIKTDQPIIGAYPEVIMLILFNPVKYIRREPTGDIELLKSICPPVPPIQSFTVCGEPENAIGVGTGIEQTKPVNERRWFSVYSPGTAARYFIQSILCNRP